MQIWTDTVFQQDESLELFAISANFFYEGIIQGRQVYVVGLGEIEGGMEFEWNDIRKEKLPSVSLHHVGRKYLYFDILFEPDDRVPNLEPETWSF